MEFQVLVNIVALLTTCIGVIIGWWVKAISANQKEMVNDLRKLEVKIPEEYATKKEIGDRLDKIDATLERLFDKLDSKVDK